MITSTQIDTIYKLYPSVVKTVGDIAYDSEGNEVVYDIQSINTQAKKDECKETAKIKLASTDWAVLPDVGLTNSAEFVAYRQTLRNYVLNPVENPSFPVEPTPAW